jgi:large subunit ribosomal protein L17
MKHKIGFNRLDRSSAHRKALHRNMVTSLFQYERITTTKAKALEIRRTAEKLITRAKIDSVHNRRLVSRRLFDEGMVVKLFSDIALRMKERPGGYTRILKLGERAGDASEIVILELVDFKLKQKEDKPEKKASKKESVDKDDKKSVAKKTSGKSEATKKTTKKEKVEAK